MIYFQQACTSFTSQSHQVRAGAIVNPGVKIGLGLGWPAKRHSITIPLSEETFTFQISLDFVVEVVERVETFRPVSREIVVREEGGRNGDVISSLMFRS